jgi:hypothetical protein
MSYVGDVMLCQGKYSEHGSIYVKEKIDVVWAYTLLLGHYFEHQHRTNRRGGIGKQRPQEAFT